MYTLYLYHIEGSWYAKIGSAAPSYTYQVIGGQLILGRMHRGGEFVRGDYIRVANSSGAKSTTAYTGDTNSGRIRPLSPTDRRITRPTAGQTQL